MSKYSNGKIYTIRCKKDDTKIYVGSTIQPLNVRFSGHKAHSKDPKKKERWYKEIDDWNNWYIELYEYFPCHNKEELNKREGEIIRLIGSLNRKIAGRTSKEYNHTPERILQKQEVSKKYRGGEKKEIIKEKKREYYKQNAESINQKVICECGCEICKRNLNEHKKTKRHIDLMSKQN